MIEDPPLLQIRRSFPRPTPQQLAAFKGAQTGPVVDSMGGRGALESAIKALSPECAELVATAVTCNNGPGDNLGLFAALDVAKPGDVVVASTDGFPETAITGDLLIGMMRNLNLAGLVTDGTVRDRAGILKVGLPVFCAGVTPNSPVRNGPGSVGLPVIVGGVSVSSGDIVVADDDGVVIVPYDRIDTVIQALQDVQKAEAEMDAKVKAGLQIPDFIREILESDRVTEVP